MTLQVGDQAPGFTLPARPRETISLRDFQGKQPVVLLFFPLAFSSVCTRELCTVADDYAAYRELGAQVLGISVDSPYVNQKFAEECRAEFPILSDFNKEVIDLYGVRREELGGLRGVANRAAFVIDASGEVVYRWVTDNPGDFPPLEEIKDAVKRAG